MSLIFTIFLTTLTSLIAYWKTRRKGTAKAASLRHAIRALLEWIGAFAFFLGINLMLGATIILLIRGLTQHSLAIYDLGNPLLLIFSAAQGFIFQRGWNRD